MESPPNTTAADTEDNLEGNIAHNSANPITPDQGRGVETPDTQIIDTNLDNDSTGGASTTVILDFDTDLENHRQQEELASAMMLSAGTTTAMPSIKPGKWKCDGKPPNPISIRKARRLLAAACAEVPCSSKGAGIHGHAWMVEKPDNWDERNGTSPMEPPEKPEENCVNLQGHLEHVRGMERHPLCHHLVQAGTEKPVAWFGEAMFLDLCVDGELSPNATPKELLAHLKETHSTNADELAHHKEVTKAFNAPCNSSGPVKEHFMRMQEAQADSTDLGTGFTDKQVITQALRQFIKHHSEDGRKGANKWSAEIDASWKAFKSFWKKKMHEFTPIRPDHKQAHAVERSTDDISVIKADVQGLMAENRLVKEQNAKLASRQHEMECAMNVEAA